MPLSKVMIGGGLMITPFDVDDDYEIMLNIKYNLGRFNVAAGYMFHEMPDDPMGMHMTHENNNEPYIGIDYKLFKNKKLKVYYNHSESMSTFGLMLPIFNIGKNSYLDNQVHVAHNVKIGNNCMIAGQVGFAGSSVIGDKVSIGGQAGVSGHLKIGNNVKIYPNTFIGDNTTIGDNTVIFSGVKIYSETIVGSNCFINSGAIVGADGFGFAPNENGEYSKIPQIGNVIIEDHVDIGAGTTIDRATLGSTIIRKGVKLDNQIQIAHNVDVGENTVIAAQTGIAGSTKIGKNCQIGGQVGIVGHITFCTSFKGEDL